MDEFQLNQHIVKVLNSEDAEAQFQLANALFEGEHVRKDDARALQLYETAAKLGHADAMNNAADMYLNGEGTHVNYQKARLLFEEAAAHHVAEAYFTLAMMYEIELGVQYDGARALHYYEQAAALDDVEAIYYLGMIYYEQLLNVDEDLFKSKELFMRAAEHGHIDALFNCGYFFECGIGGERNLEKALFYYDRAALCGDEEAKNRAQQLR